MINFELGLNLAAGAVLLTGAIWSMRTRDLEQQDNLKAACLASLLASLWLGGCVVLMFRYWGQMSEAQLVMAGLAAGCFLVSAVFMGTRAYLIRKAR